MRSGKVVGTYETHKESPDSLGYKMLGYEVPALDKKQSINSKKPTFEIKNLSTINNDPFSVNFNSESFSYATTGLKGIKYFGNTGTWAFDDNDFPTEILVSPSDGTSPFTLSLLGPIREVDQELQVQYFKGCSGSDPTMSLKLTFNRINN